MSGKIIPAKYIPALAAAVLLGTTALASAQPIGNAQDSLYGGTYAPYGFNQPNPYHGNYENVAPFGAAPFEPAYYGYSGPYYDYAPGPVGSVYSGYYAYSPGPGVAPFAPGLYNAVPGAGASCALGPRFNDSHYDVWLGGDGC